MQAPDGSESRTYSAVWETSKIANGAALRREAPRASAQTTVPLAACPHAADNVVCGS